MKLLKSEKCALIITLVFLALAIGFALGDTGEEPVFNISKSSFVGRGEKYAAVREEAFSKGETAERALIELNTCTAEQLESLKGIGPVLAERIIAYREEQGGFRTIEDITKVRGIGSVVYDDICEYIYINENDK